ncbi:hypothetical protein CWO05_05050 [Vibrio splendidus]|nr:hypothetical protein CWO05_05050 [Vibrio splendidus]
MINGYLVFAILSIIGVFLSYIGYFYVLLGYSLSPDTGVWAQLGDYAGGLLNPILSFLSLILLIKSLNLQNQANKDLRAELKINDKTEKLRSFETHFFNMINSQKVAFETFTIEAQIGGKLRKLYGVEAVIFIENQIEHLRKTSPNDDDPIVKYLDYIDLTDKIFSTARIFYVISKMVDEKLSDEEGFCEKERLSHLVTLINFTDFALLRLIMITVQFLNYPSTSYLRNNSDFNKVLNDVGLSYDMY